MTDGVYEMLTRTLPVITQGRPDANNPGLTVLASLLFSVGAAGAVWVCYLK